MLALFVCGVTLASRSNDFPYFYHTDEPKKVEQLVENYRNFHHPLLMLNAAQIALRLSGLSETYQHAAVVGRWTNAVFAAGAVVAFALLAWHWGGPLAAVSTGTLLLLENNLYEAAHYLKEDPALMFGLGCFFLASALFWEKPDALRTLAIGVAAALTASGKYIGIAAIVAAIPLVLFHPTCELSRVRRLALLLASFLATMVVINYQVLTHFDTLAREIARETHALYSSRPAKGHSRPADHAVALLFGEMALPVLLLAFIYLAWQLARFHRVTPPEWLVILFPVVLLVALLFTPKTSLRYFMPIAILLNLFAGLGIARLVQCVRRRDFVHSRLAASVLMVVLFSWCVRSQWSLWRQIDKNFRKDNRRLLAEFIRDHVGPDAIIAEDDRVYLRGAVSVRHDVPSPLVANRVIGSRFVADLGSIPDLIQHGVQYVAVYGADRRRFLKKNSFRLPGDIAAFSRRRAFYDELEKNHELVLKVKSRKLDYLTPGLKLYRLKPPAPE